MFKCPDDFHIEEELSDTEDSILTQDLLTDDTLDTLDTDTEDEEELSEEISEDEVPSPKRHNSGRARNESKNEHNKCNR